MKVQQELMRNASIQTAMNIYGRAMNDSKHKANSQVFGLAFCENDGIEKGGAKHNSPSVEGLIQWPFPIGDNGDIIGSFASVTAYKDWLRGDAQNVFPYLAIL